MFESPTREFLSRLRSSARNSGDNSLYFNPRDHQGAISTDTLAWMASLFFALACNAPVWHAALQGRSFASPATWGFAVALGVVLTTTHFVLLGLVLHRAFAKWLLAVLLLATACAVHYQQLPSAHLDPAAWRRLAGLSASELRGLFTPALWLDLALYAGLPWLVLWRARLQARAWPRALALRGVNLLVAVLLGTGSLLATSPDFETLRRDDPALRFLVTPANFFYSLHRLLSPPPAPGIISP